MPYARFKSLNFISRDKCALERLFEGRYQHKTSPCTVDVLGRSLFIERAAGNQAWFHFDELFRRNLSAVDYLALSSRFAELYICDIPQFTWEMRAEARRFVVFLDIIYDLRVLLTSRDYLYLHLDRNA
jgi:predicted ATPase